MLVLDRSTSALSSFPDELLEEEEKLLIVDDYPDIVLLLQEFLQDQGLPTITAGSVAELHQALQHNTIALTILDIGLPDGSGMDLLPVLKSKFPDMAVIMLTAVTDLHTALDCMRQGADDFLTKPVQFTEFYSTVRKVLEKRRLAINNRRYQRQIEQANFRINLLHELTLKMNSAFLTMVELDEILQAILVGITADEGLRFNRAFLALYDEKSENLEGRMAIGPGCRDDAGRIWGEMEQKELRISQIIDNIKENCFARDTEVNVIARSLKVNAEDEGHLLIRAAAERKSIQVVDGRCEYPVPRELIELLREDTFVVVPLFSPGGSLGVIIADHFVTRQPITPDLISALESFASQASLAIEHCHMYMDMEKKIEELENLTTELEKNKDLLVEAERYAALGHMAAQLVHNIRNPVTTIGGTARLLAKKTHDPEWLKFLNMMTSEATKIEEILQDLFTFVDKDIHTRQQTPLYPLLNNCMILFHSIMEKQHITHQLNLQEPDPTIMADAHLFKQMLVHLIRNSIDAMPEGGSLTIEAVYDDQQITITIRDTGPGISDVLLDRASEPFFTTKIFGTGMGLTLVKRIANDHGGTLRLANRPEGGTDAILSFPRNEKAAQA
ncbi:MAG: response regulator [Desulfobulbaceae bacterium]|nr:response regulator [Desulfobulbaceae bacterium]